MTAQKSLERALEAVAGANGVQLVIAGEGPDRQPLEVKARELGVAERVRFIGAQPRERVVELFHAADATILSSSWENFPHTLVEALVRGDARARDGGRRRCGGGPQRGERPAVPPGDTAALGEAVRRYFGDEALRERLRGAAAGSVSEYAPERVFGELEETLRRVARA